MPPFSWWIIRTYQPVHYADSPLPSNGLSDIVAYWTEPETATAASSYWREDFSKRIQPISCHSHNDYERRVPLFDALHHGCISVEADVWLLDDNTDTTDILPSTEPTLLVGHEERHLKPARTLESLYINPLVDILDHQNRQQTGPSDSPPLMHGIYDMEPNTTVVLLIDFKTDPEKLWPVVSQNLDPLRERGWLTHWTSEPHNTSSPGLHDKDTGDGTLHIRPLTVAATGSVLFTSVIANESYRDIFFDAPLDDLASDSRFTLSNSWYASAPLPRAVGKTTVFMNHFSDGQTHTIRRQTGAARERGLVARYWDTPSGPPRRRNWVWEGLLENGAEVLNVDHLTDAYGLFAMLRGS